MLRLRILCDEVDAGGGGGVVSSGDTSSIDSGHESQGSGGPAKTPSPSYLTREAMEEAMSGMASQYQQQFDRLNQQQQEAMHRWEQMQQQNRTQNQKPVVPDFKQFNSMDGYDLHSVLNQMHTTNEEKLRLMQDEMSKMRTTWEEEKRANQIYQHLSDETRKAVDQHAVFKRAGAADFLRNQIVSRIYASGGDFQKVNVPAIAAETAKFLQGLADSMYREKIKGTPGATPGATPSTAAARPPLKGAASKPGTADKKSLSWDEYQKKSKTFLADFANRMNSGD